MLQEDAPARPPLREVELDDPALVLRLHRPAHRVDEARVGHPRAQHVRVEAGAHDGAHERRVVDRGDPLTLALHRLPCAAGEAEVGQHAAELLAQRVQLLQRNVREEVLVAEAPASAAAAGAPRAAPALVGAQVREVVRVLAGEGLARRVGGLRQGRGGCEGGREEGSGRRGLWEACERGS